MSAEKVAIHASMAALPILSPNGPKWNSTIEEIIPPIAEAGYSGLEAWPHHKFTQDLKDNGAEKDPAVLEWIKSIHQAALPKGRVGNVLSRYVPTSVESMGNLKDVEEVLHSRLGLPVMAILYARTLLAESEFPDEYFHLWNTGTYCRSTQPEPETCRDFNIKTVEEYIEFILGIGIKWVADDPIHEFRTSESGHRFPNPKASRMVLLKSGLVWESHVPTNRTDMRARSPEYAHKTVESEKAFQSGDLGRIKDSWSGRNLLEAFENVELPEESEGTLPVVPEPGPTGFATLKQYLERHKRYTESIGRLAAYYNLEVIEPNLPASLEKL